MEEIKIENNDIEEVEDIVEENPELSEEADIMPIIIGVSAVLAIGASVAAIVHTKRDKIDEFMVKHLTKKGYTIYDYDGLDVEDDESSDEEAE